MNPLGAAACTLTRFAAGSRDAYGEWVEGASSTSTIYVSVQPMPGKERQGLPEGLRSKEVVKLYTGTELRTADQSAGTSGDVVTSGGVDYEVVTVGRWGAVIPHYEATAVRVSESA